MKVIFPKDHVAGPSPGSRTTPVSGDYVLVKVGLHPMDELTPVTPTLYSQDCEQETSTGFTQFSYVGLRLYSNVVFEVREVRMGKGSLLRSLKPNT